MAKQLTFKQNNFHHLAENDLKHCYYTGTEPTSEAQTSLFELKDNYNVYGKDLMAYSLQRKALCQEMRHFQFS